MVHSRAEVMILYLPECDAADRAERILFTNFYSYHIPMTRVFGRREIIFVWCGADTSVFV